MRWYFQDQRQMPEGIAVLVIFYDNDEIWYGRRRDRRFVKTDSRGRMEGGVDRDLRYIRAWAQVCRPPIPKLNYQALSARDIWLKKLHKKHIDRLLELREKAEKEEKEKEGKKLGASSKDRP